MSDRYNPIEFKLQLLALPRSVTRIRYLQGLIRVIGDRQPLPRGWDVRIHWRNPMSAGASGHWHIESLDSAVESSRDAFNGMLLAKVEQLLMREEQRKQLARRPRETKKKRKKR